MDVKGSARQGWVVDLAPADLQNDPTNGGVVSTLLPIKLQSLASPGGCEEWMLQRSQTGQA